MEDETRYEFERLVQRIQYHWVGIGVMVILILALALWNASLLSGTARLQRSLERMVTRLDSVRSVQSEQLVREAEAAQKITELENLEDEVQTKASINAVTRLDRRVRRLADTTARIDSALFAPEPPQTSQISP
jgi:predicted RecB family endonuclease